MSLSANFPTVAPSLTLDFANTKQLDPRITFTRATTATYYDGVTTAKAEENLLLRSQEIGTSPWLNSATTTTANTAVAPDGTTTADSFAGTATTEQHQLTQAVNTVAGVPFVFSVFAKKNTTNFIQLSGGFSGFGVDIWANFNLDAGTVGSTGTATTASIQNIGNGWYRCIIVGTPSSSASTTVLLIPVISSSATRNPSFDGTGTGVYIWGAQLEQRSSVSSYTATTTQPITNYIPVLLTAAAGVARFDHNPITDVSLGLLIEEQRTNLLTYSADFSNAAWNKVNSTVTPNTVVAPDGTLTGDTFTQTGASTGYLTRSSGTSVTSGTTYTFSAFVKKGDYATMYILFYGSVYNSGGSNFTPIFNLDTGVVTNTSGLVGWGMTNVGNGWWRIWASATATATTNDTSQYLRFQDPNATKYTYIWGAQLEAGAFPTSYIATTTTTVQRNADAASMTGVNFSSWYNAAEGTLYAEAQTVETGTASGSAMVVIISDGTGDNLHRVFRQLDTQAVMQTLVGNSVQTTFGFGANWTTTDFRKLIYTYKTNDFAGSLNAGTVQTDTSGTVPVVSQINLGADQSGTATFLNGTIKKISYYPLRLTNAQLQALTGS